MIPKYFKDLKENSSKRNRLLFAVIFLTALWFIIFSDHGIMKRYSLESQKKQLIEKIEVERKNKTSINKVIKKLKTDTLEIERIAREKYGMVKPGEEVFQIPKKSKE